ncbi:unnamed protein product, partial [marine sediment metagenome]
PEEDYSEVRESELRGASRKRKRQLGGKKHNQHYLTSSILLGVYD